MTPAYFLILPLLVTIVAYVIHRVQRFRHTTLLGQIARSWQMHYSPRDQLRLSARVAQAFPLPGVANLRVLDLIFGLDGDQHRYVFTAEYTLGILRAKHRVSRVVAFSEPKTHSTDQPPLAIRMADPTLPLPQQYTMMRPQVDNKVV